LETVLSLPASVTTSSSHSPSESLFLLLSLYDLNLD
jgi:hypothetical protein